MALEWWSEQPFPPLTSKNYKEWSIQIKRFVIELELWEAIDEGVEAMVEKAITERAQREARARDKRALSILQRSVDDVNFDHLVGIKSAKQAWEILRKVNQSANEDDEWLFSADIEISQVTDGADEAVKSLHRPVQKGVAVVDESNGSHVVDVNYVGSDSSCGRTNVYHSSRLIKPANGSIVEAAKAHQYIHWIVGHNVVNMVEDVVKIEAEVEVEVATIEEFLVVTRKIEMAEKKKEEGNALFKAGEYVKASQRYEKGAKLSESVSNEEKNQSKALKISCKLNNAACKLKLKDFKQVEKLCTKVLELDSRNVKAFYRRAQAYIQLFELEKAEIDIRKALEIEPDNREVKLKYKALKDKVKECNKKDAKFYSTIFSKQVKRSEDTVPMKDQENASVEVVTAFWSQPTGVQHSHESLKAVVTEEIDGENSVKDCDVSNDEEETTSNDFTVDAKSKARRTTRSRQHVSCDVLVSDDDEVLNPSRRPKTSSVFYDFCAMEEKFSDLPMLSKIAEKKQEAIEVKTDAASETLLGQIGKPEVETDEASFVVPEKEPELI
ncbi:hypothetical protein Droror1_Dr00012416, partial [Drosera rotundifolia]